MSRRYINAETWNDLLSKMTIDLGLPRPYEYYLSNADYDLPKVASLMGKEFNSSWWSNKEFKSSREEYSKQAKSTFSPLKFEICQYLLKKQAKILTDLEPEINIFKKIKIDGVITTNWDTLLEAFFPDFKTYVGQDELIFSEIYSVGEIYKIHGSLTNPESLTLTDEDYEVFHQRNPYLAAKLLTIFVEHPHCFHGI